MSITAPMSLRIVLMDLYLLMITAYNYVLMRRGHMNIFYLDHDVKLCASWHFDKHVIKMILESCQLLCAAHHMLDNNPSEELYKMTHANHPSAIWVRQSVHNYMWLWELTLALNEEYKRRYKKTSDHLSIVKLRHILSIAPDLIPDVPFFEPPQCMPEEFRTDDAEQAYRFYYCEGKKHLAVWTDTETPYWFT